MKSSPILAVLAAAALSASVRAGTVVPFDVDWRFALGDQVGAQESQFNDAGWSTVEVPHDWSIAGPIAQNKLWGQFQQMNGLTLTTSKGKTKTEELQVSFQRRFTSLCSYQFRNFPSILALSINESATHVDFMIGSPELEVDGVTAAGERVPILRDGDWQL